MAEAIEEPTEQVEIDEQEIVPINVPVLKLIKQQQLEHGLRHRDYSQYRRYCTNRARRMRQLLNFKLGEKRKVSGRKITVKEIQQNMQYIILMITNIEHDWAFAMELKQSDDGRKRHHMRNKLRKAYKKANELANVLADFTESVDARTNLETQAYCNFIMANFEFEQRAWEGCYNKFLSCQKIYASLAETLPADESGIYAEFADDLEPNLRYCQYNIGDSGETMGDLLSGAKSSLTEGKLTELLAQTKKEEAQNLNVTEWRGKKIAIRNETVRLFLLDYRDFSGTLGNSTDETNDKLLEKYGEIIMECGESIDIVKTELRQDATHRAVLEKGMTPCSDLLTYLNFIRLECTIGRYNIIAQSLTKYNEYSRVYEQVIQYCAEFIKKCEESGHGDLAESLHHDKMVFVAAGRYYQAKQAQESGQVKEAGVLILKAQSLLRNAKPSNQICEQLQLKMNQLIQSTCAVIQASILLPQNSQTVKENQKVDKEALLKKVNEFGIKFGNIDFPPKLIPVPPKPVLFDIGGIKLIEYPNLEDKVEKNKEAKKGWGSGLSRWWSGSK